MTQTQELAGQRALVTGGSRGIGRAIAQAFAEAGARVAFCHWRDAEAAAETLAAIEAAGGQGLAFEADVAEEAQVLAFLSATGDWLGGLDIAVNNAGILRERPLLETSATDFDRVLAVNLRGTFLVGREAARLILARPASAPPGRIINLASELAFLGRAGLSAYCASKGGILSLTRAWARELAPRVLVNAIAPGPIDTDMLGPAVTSPESLAEDLANPLGRLGRPEEIAALALFLAGPGASFTTGQCYGANGGSVMA